MVVVVLRQNSSDATWGEFFAMDQSWATTLPLYAAAWSQRGSYTLIVYLINTVAGKPSITKAPLSIEDLTNHPICTRFMDDNIQEILNHLTAFKNASNRGGSQETATSAILSAISALAGEIDEEKNTDGAYL